MSTTTNLKLFKHDNPTTNTNQFDVEKSLNQNWDKLDKNAGEVANQIQALDIATHEKDTSQDTEIEILKAENTLLKSQIPSATVIGETVHLEDSSNMPCQIMPLGASKQETREGYNVLPITLKSQTQKGVTITVKEDGSITLNGTSTEGFSITFSQTSIVLNGDYIFYLFGKSSRINFQGYENGNAVAYLKFSDTNQSVTKKFSTDTTITNLFCYINANTVFNNETFKFMITKGTETKPYEQYGATPSIEFESPIESVGDNINLIDARYGVDIRGNDAYRIDVMPNTDYTLYLKQICISLGATTTSQHWYKYYDETDTIIKQGQMLPFKFTSVGEILSGTKTFKTPENCTYIILDLGSYNSTPNTLQNLEVKLSKGTSTGAYSPYGQGSIEIYNCNKNLLNMGNNTFVSNGLNMVNEITKITVTGTLTSSWATASKSTSCFLKAGTYTFSIDKPLTHHIYLELTFEDGTTTALQINRNTLSKQITTDKNIIKYNVGFSGVTSGETYNEIIYLQLEQGEIATEYVEHQSQTKALYTQQPLRAIGDAKDRFVKVDGVNKEQHIVKRYIFTGNENFIRHNENRQLYYLSISNWNMKIPKANTVIASILSNYLETEAYYVDGTNDIFGDENGIAINVTSEALYIGAKEISGVTDLATFKAKLVELYNAGTPLYVDYVLVESTLIECTPEQVEVLESFNTYKNITNISSDSIGELEVTYLKDLETLLNNINQAVLGGN